MGRYLLAVVLLAACTKGSPDAVAPAPAPGDDPAIMKTPPPPKSKIAVALTSVTLADDCGGTPPVSPPPAPAAAAKSEKADAAEPIKADEAKGAAKMKRRCEQTSMQLSIVALPGAAKAQVKVKQVELFGEDGKSIGVLAASSPTRWNDAKGMYEAWDEAVAADAKLSVSYVLSQPAWDKVKDRWNKTYTLKATVTVAGDDQTMAKDVHIAAPTSLPPNVKT